MVYTYDLKENAYYEFVFLEDKALELMKNNGRWIITDPYIITQIRQIHPGLRKFIEIEGNNVKVSLEKLQQNVVENLKVLRDSSLKMYDVAIIKLQESSLLEPNKKEENNQKILNIIEKKQKWRDLDKHPKIKEAVDWSTYEQVINEIRRELLPAKFFENVPLDQSDVVVLK